MGLVWSRLAWSRARKGFFHWPSNFDFLPISEVRLVLEIEGKVRWSFVFTGKFAAKCAPCKKRNADFSRGAAAERGEPQIHADLRRTDKFSRKGAKTQGKRGRRGPQIHVDSGRKPSRKCRFLARSRGDAEESFAGRAVFHLPPFTFRPPRFAFRPPPSVIHKSLNP